MGEWENERGDSGIESAPLHAFNAMKAERDALAGLLDESYEREKALERRVEALRAGLAHIAAAGMKARTPDDVARRILAADDEAAK